LGTELKTSVRGLCFQLAIIFWEWRRQPGGVLRFPVLITAPAASFEQDWNTDGISQEKTAKEDCAAQTAETSEGYAP